MSGLRPQPDGSGYWIRADEDADGYAKAWALEAYAMCAQEPEGLEYVSARAHDAVSPIDRLPMGMLVGDRRKGATVECPAGKHLTGGGVEATDAAGSAVVSFTGGVDGEDAPAELTARAFVKGADTAPVVVAHAVCVDPLEAYNSTGWSRDVTADELKETGLGCAKGTRMLGLSVYAVQSSRGVFGENIFDGLTLTSAVPNEDLDEAFLSAALHPDFKNHEQAEWWMLGGIPYCATATP